MIREEIIKSWCGRAYAICIMGILIAGINMLLPIFMGDKIMEMQALQPKRSIRFNAGYHEAIDLEISNAFHDLAIGRIVFSFIFYFIFGYLFYASQFAW